GDVAVVAGGLPSEAVDGAGPCGRDDPATGGRRRTVLGPPRGGHHERLLDGPLGEGDVAELADERGDGLARFAPEQLADVDELLRGVVGSTHPAWNGRTSTRPWQAAEPLAARSRAASRSGTSTIQNPPSTSLVSR